MPGKPSLTFADKLDRQVMIFKKNFPDQADNATGVLRVLNFDNNPGTSDEDLKRLAVFTNLRNLSLGVCGLSSLDALPDTIDNINELVVSDNMITDDAFASFAKRKTFANLKKLLLGSNRFVSLQSFVNACRDAPWAGTLEHLEVIGAGGGCPFSDTKVDGADAKDDWRVRIWAVLPQLKSLDRKDKSGADVDPSDDDDDEEDSDEEDDDDFVDGEDDGDDGEDGGADAAAGDEEDDEEGEEDAADGDGADAKGDGDGEPPSKRARHE
eukprot:TRINITY_DN56895_c0_g1_i1.p1 TRINITY_DN56895_c0_g1~~TRINITY_DN56895_c0_g1_i1.p1  ORF type:complete len:268 (-),score=73.36 TRINITY_DN56895_c0_g1_i1:328-1131(-)